MISIRTLLSIIYFVGTAVEANKASFTNVVAFGDDNTDTGNVFTLTNRQWPLVPPYDQGRFTDGRLWIENLGISSIQNYAHIGATTDNDNLVKGFIPPDRTPVPGVRQQIRSYLKDIDIGAVDLSRTLYVIWTGANDYLNNASLTADLVVNSLVDVVYDLLVVGVTHLVLFNQPPLYAYPGFSYFHPNSNLTLKSKIVTHNQLLQSNLSIMDLLDNRASIRVFDVYSVIDEILLGNATPTLNVVDPCWTMRDGLLLSNCSNPKQYVFIDELHLTSIVHQMVADRFLQFLSSSSMDSHTWSILTMCIALGLFLICSDL
jgi:phospholipase/lecithinase/hemolysin